ncbi:hypothetical protein LguiA_014504 [Lonicera macranthoides]
MLALLSGKNCDMGAKDEQNKLGFWVLELETEFFALGFLAKSIMEDETPPNPMNLDLNLGPVDDESLPDSMNLEEWLDGPVRRIREAITQRSPFRHMPTQWWDRTTELAIDIVTASDREMGVGIFAADASPINEPKACDNNNGFLKNEAFGKRENLENGNGSEGSIYDCNICLDLAKEPVVTCCGHLFCWPCLYRWLHVHSDTKECPVCKGEVTVKNITPIYGSGSDNRVAKIDSGFKIPPRPQAGRVESWRQTIQRDGIDSIPIEEMIEILGGRFEPSEDLVQVQARENGRLVGQFEHTGELVEVQDQDSNRLVGRFESTGNWVHVQDQDNIRLVAFDSTGELFLVQDQNDTHESREIQREHNNTEQPVDPVDLTSEPVNAEAGEHQSRSALLHRRSGIHRAATLSNLTSSLSSYDRMVDSYFRSHQEQPAPVDDRDSVSSIAAVIQQSDSQTVDTTVEIDSTVSRSTSSSRRRNESRVSDVDSGESRAPRRRRFYY